MQLFCKHLWVTLHYVLSCFELFCCLSSDSVHFQHLKPVSSWQFPNWKSWYSQLLHCLLSTVKISRFPQKELLNSLLHTVLKATCPHCLDDSHLLWCSAMPVTYKNGIDAKQEAKNRGGIMLILRECPKLKNTSLYSFFIHYLFCIILPWMLQT